MRTKMIHKSIDMKLTFLGLSIRNHRLKLSSHSVPKTDIHKSCFLSRLQNTGIHKPDFKLGCTIWALNEGADEHTNDLPRLLPVLPRSSKHNSAGQLTLSSNQNCPLNTFMWLTIVHSTTELKQCLAIQTGLQNTIQTCQQLKMSTLSTNTAQTDTDIF